jgi:hypothetical protein
MAMNIVLLLVDGCSVAGGWCPELEAGAPRAPATLLVLIARWHDAAEIGTRQG